MRILLASGFFPPNHVAGSEKRTLGYGLALRGLGHDVQVVCAESLDEGPQHWNGYADDVYRGIAVRRVHLNWKLAPDPNRYLYNNPVVANHLVRWIAEWQPDVAHIISCYTLSASVIKVLKQSRVPTVLTLVDFWFVCPRLSLLHASGSMCDGRVTSWDCLRCMVWGAKAYRWPRRVLPEGVVKSGLVTISRHPLLSRQRGLRGMALDIEDRRRFLAEALNDVDVVIAPSCATVDTMHGAGVTAPVRVIRSGHDLAWLDRMPVRRPSSVIRFGYIGQIRSTKGVYELVSVFVQGGLEGKAELHIYGDVDADPGYVGRVSELLVGRPASVSFHGPFAPDQLGEVLAGIDVLVVPSIWHENSPRVIQEAFAARVPVVASDVPGIAEFVRHGIDGLLFARGDASDLARQMQRFTRESLLLPHLQSGIPAVKSVKAEVDELVGVYQRLVQEYRFG